MADGTKDDVCGVAGGAFEVPATEVAIGQNWSRKSAQCDRWSFCLAAGTLQLANQEEAMQRRPRRNHTPAFKMKVVFAAIKGHRTFRTRGLQYPALPQ